MKAIRTKAQQTVNPLFSHAEKQAAKEAGEEYETQEFIELPVGQEIDHPDCWRLVVKGFAVPADPECTKQVLDYLGEPGRRQMTEHIIVLREAAKSNSLSAKDRKMKEMLEKAYAVELGLTNSPVPGYTPPQMPARQFDEDEMADSLQE